MSVENEREILLGLIFAVDFHASLRQLTDADRPLTPEELQENAQATLDWIADACSQVLDKYKAEDLESVLPVYKAWRDKPGV